MKVEVHYIAEDIAISAAYSRRWWHHGYLVAAGLLAAIPGSLVALAFGRQGWAVAGLAVASLGGLAWSTYSSWQIPSEWLAVPPTTYTATDEYLEWESTGRKSRIRWGHLSQISVLNGRLLIQEGADLFVIPSRSFSSVSAFESFVERARSRAGRAPLPNDEFLPGPLAAEACVFQVAHASTRADHKALLKRSQGPLLEYTSKPGVLLGVGSWLQMMAVPNLEWAFFSSGQILSAWAFRDIALRCVGRIAACFARPEAIDLLPRRIQLSRAALGLSTRVYSLEVSWSEFWFADRDDFYMYLFEPGPGFQGIAIPKTAFSDPADFERFWQFTTECLEASRPDSPASSVSHAVHPTEPASFPAGEGTNPYRSPRSQESDLADSDSSGREDA